MNSTDSRDWGQGGGAGPGRLLRAGPARALSFTAAALFCLVIVLYPQLLVRHGGPPNHGALVLGLIGMAAGFVHGVGFEPRRPLFRILLGPLSAWLLLPLGTWLLLT
jgi:predicted membrane protein